MCPLPSTKYNTDYIHSSLNGCAKPTESEKRRSKLYLHIIRTSTGLIFQYVRGHYDLDLQPTDLKINMDHLHYMIMPVPYLKDLCKFCSAYHRVHHVRGNILPLLRKMRGA